MTVPADYEVVAYQRDLVKRLFADHAGADTPAIASKQHIEYFNEYLDFFQAKTVVVEKRYVDHDYLDDFAGYYVRCFAEYGRIARRLHFFRKQFSEAEFTSLLSGGGTLQHGDLQAAYLGFIVVKPLPQTIVGRTCLKTYDDQSRRHFPSARLYEANLFGLRLEVKTLAYQEQDRVAAACATSALWAVFQGTALLFGHAVPSPVEITKAGTLHVPRSPIPAGRAFPNEGLTATQIAYAVRHVGLEAHVLDVQDAHGLKSTAYAYLKGKVPLLLVVQLGEFISGTWSPDGLHAIAATGYNIGAGSPAPYGSGGCLFTSSRVDKLYGHDDQVGPFARLPILDASGRMATQWQSAQTPGGRQDALPWVLLVPLYNKIRILNSRIEEIVVVLDQMIEVVRAGANIGIAARVEWDVHLTYVSDVKARWLRDLTNPRERLRLLPMPLPRFLWRVVAIADGKEHLELLFDATDVDQGRLFVAGVDHVGKLTAALRGMGPRAATSNDLAVRTVVDRSSDFYSP